MTAEQIRAVTTQRPFKPFRIELVSGETIEIRRTLRAAVAEKFVFLGTNEDSDTGLSKRFRIVPTAEIRAVEVIEPAASN